MEGELDFGMGVWCVGWVQGCFIVCGVFQGCVCVCACLCLKDYFKPDWTQKLKGGFWFIVLGGDLLMDVWKGR